MNAEFNWWLLIVGLVLGAALTWLVMAESTRRDADVVDTEQRSEARWIASTLTAAGRETDADRVEDILRLHREYLGAPPPDDPAEVKPTEPTEPADRRPDPGPGAERAEAAPIGFAGAPGSEDGAPDLDLDDPSAGLRLPDATEVSAKDRA